MPNSKLDVSRISVVPTQRPSRAALRDTRRRYRGYSQPHSFWVMAAMAGIFVTCILGAIFFPNF